MGIPNRGVGISVGSDFRPVRFEAWRLGLIYLVVALTLTGFIIRLINLQVFDVELYQARAIDNYTNEVSIPAPRGIIYDRNGYILARNIAAYNVVITPANLPADDLDIQLIYRELSELVGVPAGSFVANDPESDAIFLSVPGGLMTEELLEEAKLFAACVPCVALLSWLLCRIRLPHTVRLRSSVMLVKK